VTVQKSWTELQTMARACRIVVDALDALEAAAVPGTTTKEMDRIAREHIERAGARPRSSGTGDTRRASASRSTRRSCTGSPGRASSARGTSSASTSAAIVDGFFGDAARTVAVGRVSEEAARLMRVTRDALFAGIDACHPGKRVGDIGTRCRPTPSATAIPWWREFVGHGIGTSLHEEPQVPNYGPPGRRERLVAGMCLAIEPMVNVGKPEVEVLGDAGRR